MKRLHTLLLSNNRISHISPSLYLSAPNLTTIVFTNNLITELGDLEPLQHLRFLEYLSLLGNPVRERKWYREWLAFRIKPLRVLDFQRIREKVSLMGPAFTRAQILCLLEANLFRAHAGTDDSEIIVCDRRRIAHRSSDNSLDDGIGADWQGTSLGGAATDGRPSRTLDVG